MAQAETIVQPLVRLVTKDAEEVKNAIEYHNETLQRNFSQFTPTPNGNFEKTPIGSK
jgi:hypothetical protein